MSHRLAFGISLVLAVAMASTASGAPGRTRGVKTWSWSFAADTLGIAPPNTATYGGSWEVVVDSTRASHEVGATGGAMPDSADSAAAASAFAAAPRVLRQSEADDGIKFHFIQFKKPVLDDQAVSVRFRILAGDIDPTAGLMFQVDPKGRNGYIVRVSGETNQLIVHYFIYGKRRDLKSAPIPALTPGTWHTLSVVRKGAMMVVSYDGEERLRIRDERYSGGSVGLWTEDDTVVDFEKLAVSNR